MARMRLMRLLLGRRLANTEETEVKIGPLEGVPEMGLDGLSSSAYGPEAALSVLAPLGLLAPEFAAPILAVILVLLTLLYLSYRQTIKAYPNNGGAYVVAKSNLGVQLSLAAAAALMIDYVLNVAVGISAGVAALVSMAPGLQGRTLELCLGLLAVITLANLRGLRESGRLFAIPTYLFVACFLALLGWGAAKAMAAGGHPAPLWSPPRPQGALKAASWWLLLRAFAAGCTAMTGVEAVSNGVSAFREPTVKNARMTLGLIVLLLGLLLLGVGATSWAYHVGAMDQTRPGYQSVLSQLAGAIVGRGPLYYVAMASVLSVLALSADTSFVGFPLLCRMVAEDGYLPRPFAIAGRRLVFTVGILYLAGAAALLLILFGGVTDRLIPLFAIGAFLTFTLSQAGMVEHWRRLAARGRGWSHRLHLTINLTGAVATGTALVAILVAKFVEGAWITVVALPSVIALLHAVKRYYRRLDAELDRPVRAPVRPTPPRLALVPVRGATWPDRRALSMAMSLSCEVIAIHMVGLEGPQEREDERALRERWRRDIEQPCRAAGVEPPRLIIAEATYRKLENPILEIIREFREREPDAPVAVCIPDLVKTSLWQHMLHAHYGWRLRSALLSRGGSGLFLMTVPSYLREPPVEGSEEEAGPFPAAAAIRQSAR
jgi:amino acid transporter